MIGIIVAMERELSLLEGLLHDVTKHDGAIRGVVDSREVVVMQSGIGKVSAAMTTQRMIAEWSPEVILSSGVAGGIDDSLRVMDIVVSSECTYHDVWCGEPNERGQVQGYPPRFTTPRDLHERAMSVKSEVRLMGGVIATGDQFITSREELEQIKRNFPDALAVDMESAAIAQVCHHHSTPLLSCRIISDTPSRAEDHSQQYNDFWGSAPTHSIETIRQIIGVI